jgi:myo-inositol-1(or 4)-monophosphatase
MNLKDICDKTADVAIKAGDFIAREAQKFEREQTEIKSLNSLVSYVDKEAEAMIVELLSEIVPEAGFIAEEGTGKESPKGLNWVIDPLDGTTNFIHGVPTYAVSIALIQNEKPLVGIVYEINRKECFTAYHEGGAYLNGKRIYVSKAKSIQESLIATGFPYHDFEKSERYTRLLGAYMKKCRGLRRIGSAAVDLAYVAAGRFEAFYEYNLNSWDVAAGVCLVREAGGIISNFEGGDEAIFSKEILAACAIHEEMLNDIKHYFVNGL